MTDEVTKQVILPENDINTDEAMVDGITLVKGNLEPTDLTEDQIKRLEDAGVELQVVDPGDDPVDRIRTHEEADAALRQASITVADGTSVEDKKDALRNRGS